MHFLQPIWLAAMAAVVLPVIVHFWNDRRGKVLRVGSVALLEGASQRMSWSRRISEWWLLLLRCLLVMALALVLAGPYWTPRAVSVKGWVLADSGAVGFYGKSIDSLVAAGWARRELRGDDYWRSFRAEDGAASGVAEFRIFSSGVIHHFRGVRPTSGRVVHWDIYAPKDSVREWKEKAWVVSADSGWVMRGVAKLTGSTFAYQMAAREEGMDTSVLDIGIYADAGYQQEVHYLKAGLQAVQEFTHRRMRVGMTGSSAEGAGRLFWLSSKPRPSGAIGDSSWKDLVWDREFPAVLARLVLGEEGPGKRDLRMIDQGQVAPLVGRARAHDARMPTIDLGPAVWVLLLLLFVTERWLSKRA
ncbi:MAG: BatA domain-containing protein [Bacteroidetes bacterium]|nr:BatA domain-containing protein [Bacteroidota bacterium]